VTEMTVALILDYTGLKPLWSSFTHKHTHTKTLVLFSLFN